MPLTMANDVGKLSASEVAAVVEGASGSKEESAGAIFGAFDGIGEVVKKHIGHDILLDFVVAKILDARYNSLSAVLSSGGRDPVSASDKDSEMALGGLTID